MARSSRSVDPRRVRLDGPRPRHGSPLRLSLPPHGPGPAPPPLVSPERAPTRSRRATGGPVCPRAGRGHPRWRAGCAAARGGTSGGGGRAAARELWRLRRVEPRRHRSDDGTSGAAPDARRPEWVRLDGPGPGLARVCAPLHPAAPEKSDQPSAAPPATAGVTPLIAQQQQRDALSPVPCAPYPVPGVLCLFLERYLGGGGGAGCGEPRPRPAPNTAGTVIILPLRSNVMVVFCPGRASSRM